MDILLGRRQRPDLLADRKRRLVAEDQVADDPLHPGRAFMTDDSNGTLLPKRRRIYQICIPP